MKEQEVDSIDGAKILDGIVNNTDQHEVILQLLIVNIGMVILQRIIHIDGYGYDASYFGFRVKLSRWMVLRQYRLDRSCFNMKMDKSPNGNDFTAFF